MFETTKVDLVMQIFKMNNKNWLQELLADSKCIQTTPSNALYKEHLGKKVHSVGERPEYQDSSSELVQILP